MRKPKISRIKFDDGSSTGGFLTSDNTLIIKGTARPGSKVKIFDNGELIGQVKVDKKGKWTFKTEALEDGGHGFQAKAKAGAGGVKQSKVVSGDVDTAAPPAPTVALTAISDVGASSSDAITANNIPTLDGLAEAGATITVWDGGVALGQAVADASGYWSYATPPLAEGVHAFSVTARDAAGNTSAPSPVLEVMVDQSITGTLVIDAITADNVVNIAEGGVGVTITGTVTGEVPDGATVTVEVSGAQYDAIVSGGAFTVTVPGAALLADGDLTVTASVTFDDVAGNSGTVGGSQAYALDQTPPSGTITILSVAVDDVVNIAESTATVVVSGTVTGEVPDGATVTLTVNGKAFTGTVSSGAFSIDVDGADLVADAGLAVTASVTITDDAGNGITLTDTRDYSLDLTAPVGTITLDAVTSDGIVNIAEGEGDVAITGTVSGDVPDGATVTITVDGEEYTGTVASGAFSIDVPGAALLADGDVTVDASVTFSDAAGNEGSASDTQAYALDQEGPTGTVTLDAVTEDSVINIAEGEDDVAITGTVGGDVPDGATVTLTVNGKTFTGTVSAGAFSIDVPGADLLADTGLSVAASVGFADAAGNPGSASDSAAYTLDQEAPEAATITGYGDDTGAIGDGVTQDTTLTLSGTAGAGLDVEIFDGTTSLGTTTADDNGDWTFDTGELEGGDHSFTAVAIDDAGNAAEASSALDVTVQTARFVHVATFAPAEGLVIRGAPGGGLSSTSERAGYSVSSAGDVNGDGIDDIIIGAPGSGQVSGLVGTAYVVFGTTSGFGTLVDGRAVLDLANLDAAQGFVIEGVRPNDSAGRSVTAADVNGDGYDDLIFGANGGDAAGAGSGEVYVVFGTAGGFGTEVDGRQVVDVATLDASEGFVVTGAAFGGAGHAVSDAGDVNGDGYADFIIGAPNASLGGSFGEAYVIFGSAGGFGTDVDGRQVIDIPTLSAGEGFVIKGESDFPYAGWAVSSAGDVNGDGLEDIVVGVYGVSNEGAAYVIFGTTGGFGSAVDGRQVVALSTLGSAQGFVIIGEETNDFAGYSVSSAGDVNGDGYDDLIIGARGSSAVAAKAGQAYVVYGTASGFGVDVDGRQVIDLAELDAAQGFVIQGVGSQDKLGTGVSSAGDVNGDGYDDLIVGAPGVTDGPFSGGAVYVVFGSATGAGTELSGRQVLDAGSLKIKDGFTIIGGATGTLFGTKVSSAGDVNGDGYDDILVGDGATGAGGGEAYIVYGSATIESPEPVTTSGTGVAEMLVGGAGDDVLSGGGGADVIRSGAGDDTITVTDLAFRKIDGGTGTDTLVLGGAGLSLDLTDRLQAAKIDGIEAIDLDGGGNTLTLDKLAVLNETPAVGDGTHILVVRGEAADAVSLAGDGWSHAGTIVVDTVTFERYVNGDAEVRVQQGVDVTIPPIVIDLSTLNPAQGFVIQGDAVDDRAGWSVSDAGDVNGDGYDDVIVGATYGDDGGILAGEAYVIFGSAAGFGTDVAGRQVIDLTSLSAAQGFVIQGDAIGDKTGVSVSSAGDINGDGYDDVIVGAKQGGGDTGQAYVVFGSGSGFGADVGGRQVIDLSTLNAAQGFVIQGDEPFDEAGWSVSSAGDVNGDGYDDVIVGARYGDDGGSSAGEAYVLFGSASGFGTDVGGRQVIDLATLSPAQGFIIQGDAVDDYAGSSVSSAGDIDGDGYGDLIVGAPRGDDGGDAAGEAYVIFGSASGFGTDVGGRQVIDLTSLSAVQGFVIQGHDEHDWVGFSVSSAGDVNGDGYDDLIVGATYAGISGTVGEAYVIFGTPSGFGTRDGVRQVIDLTDLSAAEGFVIEGAGAYDYAGWSVSSAGDVNGDGYDDLIVGAPGNDDGGNYAGATYVVFGSGAGFGDDVDGRQVIDLTNLKAGQGFIIRGASEYDYSGRSVSAAGDVNGDGYDDLIVGAPGGDDGGSNAGAGYIVYGGAFGQSVEPIDKGVGYGDGLLAGGPGDDTLYGYFGEDYDVYIAGAGDDTITNSGMAFRKLDGGSGTDTLIFGSSGTTLDLTDRLMAARIDGIERYNLVGNGNTLVVDKLAVLNETPAGSDGVHVLTVLGSDGATLQFGDPSWSMAGTVSEGDVTFDRYVNGNAEVRVEQGVVVTIPTVPAPVIDLGTLTAAQGFVIQGDTGGDWAGYSVSDAGDVNGDGFADLIVGAPQGDDGGSYAGEAYVIFGSSSGFGTEVGGRRVIDLTSLSAATGFVIQGGAASDRAGWRVSSAGDLNGDGYDDLIVGAPFSAADGYNSGEAFVVFGGASGFGSDVGGRQVVDLTSLSAATGFVIQGDAAFDQAGWSVSSAGDVNGDGFDDLIIGAKGGSDGGYAAGEAYVVYGSASGFGVDVDGRQIVDLTTLTPDQGFIIQGAAVVDRAGSGVGSADVNGDGYADLIVGARYGDSGGDYSGEVYVIFGAASGIGSEVDGRQVVDLATLSADRGFLIAGVADFDLTGGSVSSAGDVNGDGYEDLIIGADSADGPADGSGIGYVVFGSGTGFGVDVGGRQVIDLATLDATQGFVVWGAAGGDNAGRSVSSAGDVNGDGYDDIIVGAPLSDPAGGNAGNAYVIFGKASVFGVDVDGRQVIELSSLSPEEGFIIQGAGAGDQAGRSVSAAGDVNGDGFDDLIVGANYGNDGGTDAGQAYVVYGGAFGSSTTPVTTEGTDSAEILIGGAGDDVLSGGGAADVIRSGAGDDTITVTDLDFFTVDGGTGSDTLHFAGPDTGLTIDFTAAKRGWIASIEAIDTTSLGDDIITLGALDVLDFSETIHEAFTGASSHRGLVVRGNSGDMLYLEDLSPSAGSAYAWVPGSSDVQLDGSSGGDYDTYDLMRDGKVVATVAVESDVTVMLAP